MRRSENARYRAVNPRWMLLHYRLGILAHATPRGGGPTDDSHIDRVGKYIGGTLDYQNVTMLQLPPRSAALLKRAP